MHRLALAQTLEISDPVNYYSRSLISHLIMICIFNLIMISAKRQKIGKQATTSEPRL